MLGASYYLNNHPNWFLAVGLISRFFMGAARAGYGATTFAYAPLLWPDKVKRMIGILESCTGKAEKIASPLFINIIILHYRYK